MMPDDLFWEIKSLVDDFFDQVSNLNLYAVNYYSKISFPLRSIVLIS